MADAEQSLCSCEEREEEDTVLYLLRGYERCQEQHNRNTTYYTTYGLTYLLFM